MTLGEFKEQTRGISDDLELEIYSERYNELTQPKHIEFDTEGYIDFIIDDDRWDLVDKESIFIIPDGATNGDIIKAVFPKCKEYKRKVTVEVDINIYGDIWYLSEFDLDWWNEPYKKEVEE